MAADRRAFLRGIGTAVTTGGLVTAGTPASAAGTGTVTVTVSAVEVDGDSLRSWPFPDAGVFLGAWQAGQLLGRTDDQGQVTVELPAGNNELSIQKITSSHTLTERTGIEVEVSEGGTTSLEVDIAPETVDIIADVDVGYGNAVYVTGETEFLGNWETATKLSYDTYYDDWRLTDNVPLYAEFKLVREEWVDGLTISTDGVDWETGSNHTIEDPGYYFKSVNEVTPTF
jgi:hypothetical protein